MEGMPNNNQQMGSKLTPQQQYMMAQKQAYMQRMRQQYMYQQRMMMQQRMAQQKQQGFVKQTMQSPQQVANQMNNKGVNPMQNANMGSVNQPLNNSPEYNFYKFNQQPANQNELASKSQVKIQWKFDEGAKQNIPTPQAQQPVQTPQQSQQNFQAAQQARMQVQMQQPRMQAQQVQNQPAPQAQRQPEVEVDELEGLQIEHEGQIYDVEHMSIEETKQLREKLLKERDEAIAKLNLILARDPNLNPVRLEDFPYYAAVKKIQKGV